MSLQHAVSEEVCQQGYWPEQYLLVSVSNYTHECAVKKTMSYVSAGMCVQDIMTFIVEALVNLMCGVLSFCKVDFFVYSLYTQF